MVTILTKGSDSNEHVLTSVTKRKGFATPEILHLILNRADNETDYGEIIQSDLYEGNDFKIHLLNSTESDKDPKKQLLDKIREKSDFKLDPKLEVAQGIVPNPDIVSNKALDKISPENQSKYDINAGDGVFVIKKGYLNELTDEERKYLKPLYEPYELDRYYFPNSHSKEIIYLTKKNYKNGLNSLIMHLKKFREIMDDRRENKNGRLEFFHLHWPRNEKFFNSGPKIFSVRKCKTPTFAYTEKPAYGMLSVNIIISDRIDLKYLLALFNSNLVAFWLKHKGKMQGDQFQVDKTQILEIPLKNTNDKQPFIDLINQILNIQNKDLNNEIENYKKKIESFEIDINKLIYDLYDLTPDEINILESDFEKDGV